jgi:hypothetical protein
LIIKRCTTTFRQLVGMDMTSLVTRALGDCPHLSEFLPPYECSVERVSYVAERCSELETLQLASNAHLKCMLSLGNCFGLKHMFVSHLLIRMS